MASQPVKWVLQEEEDDSVSCDKREPVRWHNVLLTSAPNPVFSGPPGCGREQRLRWHPDVKGTDKGEPDVVLDLFLALEKPEPETPT